MLESAKYWLLKSVPAPTQDPDPELLQIFGDKESTATADGDVVLQRLTAHLRLELVVEPKQESGGIIYEELVGAAAI
jgi:hypothetical protein